MKKQEFVEEMKKRGWNQDRWGHFQKEVSLSGDKRIMRLKVQKISVRVEKQIIYAETQYTKATKGWLHCDSAYMRDIRIENGKLIIGKYKI